MSVTRSSFVKAMVKDSYSYFIEKYEAIKPVFDQIFETDTSDAS